MRCTIIVGNGVHISQKEDEVRDLCKYLDWPVLSTWTGGDICPDLPLHIGHFGIFGDRASNLVVQNSEFLLVLGASLCIPQTGYQRQHFARGARIQRVNLQKIEEERPVKSSCPEWKAKCLDWKERYGIETEKRERKPGYINSFDFIRELSAELPSDAIVVTDMGTSFTCTFQAARMKYGQRWLTASGFAPMGYGIPGALGAYYATKRPVLAIVGDGALQFNVQELQSIRGLPIKVIVLENGGYLTIKHTQANHFGNYVGSKFDFSNIMEVAKAFGVEEQVRVVHMDPMQPLTPRTSSMKLPDGSISSRPLEDMFPFMNRGDLKKEMIVPMVEAFQ